MPRKGPHYPHPMSPLNCEHLELESLSVLNFSLDTIASPGGRSYAAKERSPQSPGEPLPVRDPCSLLVWWVARVHFTLWNHKTQCTAGRVGFRYLRWAVSPRWLGKRLPAEPAWQALVPSLPVVSSLRASCTQGPGSQTVCRVTLGHYSKLRRAMWDTEIKTDLN